MFDGSELQAMSDEGVAGALRRAHGAAAFAQAAEVRAVRELYRRHRAGNTAPGAGGARAGEFTAAEISSAVQVSEHLAAALIDIGLALDALPHTREAFGSGRLDLARVQVIVDSTRGLPGDLLVELEPPLVEAAARTTPALLRHTARSWRCRLDDRTTSDRRLAQDAREDCPPASETRPS